MRYITIDKAKPGMILGRGIYDFSDRTLLAEGKTMNMELIQRLEELGYAGIYIEDELSRDIIIQSAITDGLRKEAVDCLKNQDVDGAAEAAKQIVSQIMNADVISLDLVDLRTYDDYTFCHSVNVAVLSTVVGLGMGYSYADVVELCTAAIFHDFGKMMIDKKILNKPGKLSAEEFAMIKRHPRFSYNLLADRWNISSKVRMGVLGHHENEDGSGYPNGLKGDKIHPFAKIIHVTDVYDALSSRRPYKEACSFSESVEYLMGGGGTLFDQKVVEAFINCVPVYPKGMTVELSDGREAIVMENNGLSQLRPKLKLVDGSILELNKGSEHRNLTIVRQAGMNALTADAIIRNEMRRREKELNAKNK